MSAFEAALGSSAFPRRLGDVRLSYDTPVLIAETERPRRGWRSILCFLAALAAGLFAVAWLLSHGSVAGAASLGLLAAFLFACGALMEAHERRRRRFVADFSTLRLRLEFTTPIGGMPRTMYVPFERIVAVDVLEQGDGRLAMTVDFRPAGDENRLLREVLVANVAPGEAASLERLRRLLEGAFGLAGPAEAQVS